MAALPTTASTITPRKKVESPRRPAVASSASQPVQLEVQSRLYPQGGPPLTAIVARDCRLPIQNWKKSDDKFGGVAKRNFEQAIDGGTGTPGHLFRAALDPFCQGHNSQNRGRKNPQRPGVNYVGESKGEILWLLPRACIPMTVSASCRCLCHRLDLTAPPLEREGKSRSGQGEEYHGIRCLYFCCVALFHLSVQRWVSLKEIAVIVKIQRCRMRRHLKMRILFHFIQQSCGNPELI